MKGNDLSAEPTRRYYVLSDVVFMKHSKLEKEQGFLKKFLRHKITWMPDLVALAQLWQFSSKHGVRLELIFVGEDAKEAPELWELLDKGAANPFSDWVGFEQHQDIARSLAYRPDLLGVVDTPDRVPMYGGRGMLIDGMR